MASEVKRMWRLVRPDGTPGRELFDAPAELISAATWSLVTWEKLQEAGYGMREYLVIPVVEETSRAGPFTTLERWLKGGAKE